MREAYSLAWSVLVLLFRSRVSLEAEILILRHQLNIQQRHVPKRVAFSAVDRLIFVGLYRLVPNAHQGADDREARYRHPLAPCRFTRASSRRSQRRDGTVSTDRNLIA